MPTDDPTRTAGLPLGSAATYTLRPGAEVTRSDPHATTSAAPLPATDPPPPIPGFVLDGELARGGMGVVYHATQLGLNRPAAVKLVLGGRAAEPRQVIRFLAEAEAVAAIDHPNVVRVYAFGEAGGVPYLALEFCPGGTLSSRLAAGRLPPREAAEVVAAVADGVQAAHALGIVHRDLKPGNVLFDAAGRPRVTDFGLAKRGVGTHLTVTQSILGTPAYMSPEQGRGDNAFVGPPADVWALGVVLYEAVVGTRPFDAPDAYAIIKRVVELEPVRPSAHAAGLSRDLELIVLKCLRKDARDRYPTAGELAADLRAWLGGRPVTARPLPTAVRVWRWARRSPSAAVAASLVAMTLAVGVAAIAATVASERQRRLNKFEIERSATEAREAGERAVRLRQEYEADVGNGVRQGRLRGCVAAFDRAVAAGVAVTPAMRLDVVRWLVGLYELDRARLESVALNFDGLPADFRGQAELWSAVTLFGVDDERAAGLVTSALGRSLSPADRAFAEALTASDGPTAVSRFREVIRRDPLHQPARSSAALMLLWLGEADPAIELAEQSAALFPDHPDFPGVLVWAHAFRGNLRQSGEWATRLAALVPAGQADAVRQVAATLPFAVRLLRGRVGYGEKPSLLDLVRAGVFVPEMAVRAKGVGVRSLAEVSGVAAHLPPVCRNLIVARAETLFQSLSPRDRSPTELNLLADRCRRYPEGLLQMEYAAELFSRANSSYDTDPAAYRSGLLAAAAAFDRAAELPAVAPVQDIALDLAYLCRALVLRADDQAGLPPAATLAAEVRAALSRRLRMYGDVPVDVSWSAFRAARHAGDNGLARQVLDSWERRAPQDLNVVRSRAMLEFDAEAYHAAIRAAEKALARKPDDAEMKSLLAAARRWCVPYEVAPMPRLVTPPRASP